MQFSFLLNLSIVMPAKKLVYYQAAFLLSRWSRYLYFGRQLSDIFFMCLKHYELADSTKYPLIALHLFIGNKLDIQIIVY